MVALLETKEEKKQMKFYNLEMQLINLSDIQTGYNPISSLGNLTSLNQSNKHSDEKTGNLSFIDNNERKDYNPIDEARRYKYMQDKYGKKECSTRNLTKKYGKSNAYYGYKLQLLELPNEIQEVLTRVNSLTEKHCRHICKLLNRNRLRKKFEAFFAIKFDDWDRRQIKRFNQEIRHRQQVQIDLSKTTIKNEWSVKQTESHAKKLLDELKERDKKLDDEIEETEEQRDHVEHDIKDINVGHRKLKKSIGEKSEERHAVLYVMRTTQNKNYIESRALIKRAKSKGVPYDLVDWDRLQGADLTYGDRVRRLDRQIGKTYTDEEFYSPDYEKKYNEMYEHWATHQGMYGGILYDE